MTKKKKLAVAPASVDTGEPGRIEAPDTTRAISKLTHHCALVKMLVDDIDGFLNAANQDAKGNAEAIKAAKSALADAATKIDELIQ